MLPGGYFPLPASCLLPVGKDIIYDACLRCCKHAAARCSLFNPVLLMLMTASAGFLLYAALYRLTALAVGALSIWLGFRLFSNAAEKNGAAESSGSASAEGNGFKLALTSILPGTYFALFGTVIIGIMLWKGEPQLEQKSVTEITDQGEVRSEHQLMRHSESNLDGPAASAQEGEKSGITVAEAAEMMENIAKLLRGNLTIHHFS